MTRKNLLRLGRRRTKFTTRSRACQLLGVTCAIAVTFFGVVGASSGGSATSQTALSTLQSELTMAVAAHTLAKPTIPPLSYYFSSSDFGIPAEVHNCTPSTTGISVPTCVFGDVSVKVTVVLYGNSQAQAWMPALNALALADHFRLIPIAKPACGTFVDAGYLDPGGHESPICTDFVKWSIIRIKQIRPALVVVASTPGVIVKPGVNRKLFPYPTVVPTRDIDSTPPGRTAADFAQFVRDISSTRARIVLMGDIPLTFESGGQDQVPNGCLLTHESDVSKCLLIEPTMANSEWHRAFVDAANLADVPFINTLTLMCVNNRCPLVVDHRVVKFNQIHVSSTFATFVAPALGELMRPQLP